MEEKTVNGTTWGRTDRGWISLDYVKPVATEFPAYVPCIGDPDFYYQYHEINPQRFTINGDLKTYTNHTISFSIPVDWLAEEAHGEDCSDYSFDDPTGLCSLNYTSTYSDYFFGYRTEEEYYKLLSHSGTRPIEILSYTEAKISGFSCKKLVYSYTSNGTEYIATWYDYVITGWMMYDFTIVYPAAESERLAPVFDAIIDSIVLLTY